MSTRSPRPEMGIATEQSHTNKLRYKSFLNSFEQSSAVAIEGASHAFFETDAHIDKVVASQIF